MIQNLIIRVNVNPLIEMDLSAISNLTLYTAESCTLETNFAMSGYCTSVATMPHPADFSTRLLSGVPFMFLTMIQGSFFPEPSATVPDEEVVEALQDAIARSGRLSRSGDLLLCGVCARYLVGELRGLGLEVVRAPARHSQ
jgi:hypothetical protein